MINRGARYVNVVLGVWLFASAFLWRHSPLQFTNTWAMGMLTAVTAALAMGMPTVRFANTVIAVWLVISSFALPRLSNVTAWHNALIGGLIGLVSLIESGRVRAGRPEPIR